MNHELRCLKVATLIVKAESLDARLRRESRPPLESERVEYESVVAELSRRREEKVLPYYRERLDRVYRPSVRYVRGTSY